MERHPKLVEEHFLNRCPLAIAPKFNDIGSTGLADVKEGGMVVVGSQSFYHLSLWANPGPCLPFAAS